jgi:radical SAM-linked protein
VYVPSFFDVYDDEQGFQRLVPKQSHYRRVTRSIVPSLDELAFPTRPIVPFGRPVHDRLRVEIARGCSRGCRFCQAGMIYRPVRERSPERLLSLTQECIAGTGYEDMSLLSLSSGDYGCVVPVMERLMERYASDHLAVSLPSLRAGTLTPELMKLIKRVRKTGFTIAPEAGSQRLRDAINKNIGEDEIRETVRDAVGLGWRLIKLYFMIGLPTETEDDLQELIGLVTSLQQVKGPKKERINLNVGVATFIPKPHTPFQWASQIPLSEARRTMGWLKDRLRTSRIQLKWQNPEVSRIEAVFARGDRRLTRPLLTAYRKGCVFDSWTDRFNYELWRESFEECGVDPDFYTTRIRIREEPLPWDHIDIGVTKEYLAREWGEALSGNLTADCRHGECQGCGVCDFERITPEVYLSCDESSTEVTPNLVKSKDRRKVVVDYSKQGQAKYFGHLELVNIFNRAVRRSGIAVRYSQGFHPKPRISFDDALPIGMESQSELMYVQLEDEISMEALRDRLNEQLPDGLVVNECRCLREPPERAANKAVTYEITLSREVFDDQRLRDFEKSAHLVIVRSNGKGVSKRVDLREAVIDVERLNAKQLRLKIVQEPGKTVRPAEFLQHVFEFEANDVKTARVLKVRNPKNTSGEMI